MNLIFDILSSALPELKISKNESMANHTTFRIGGPAKVFIEPKSEDELSKCYKILRENGIEPIIIGRGSNLLVRDEGIEGVVIHLGEDFAAIAVEDTAVYAEAGASLAAVASAALQHSLTGMEFAHGIPGSLGGALFMNAGAYGGEMSQIVDFVRYMDAEGAICEREVAECSYGYRHSIFEEEQSIILGAKIRLEKGDKEAIAARMRELSEKRIASQPLDKPSAGSTFKRPATGYAAAMIDQSGLKGFTVGGAQVSEKHAGFVINANNATFADVTELMARVQEKVHENFGVILEPEVKII